MGWQELSTSSHYQTAVAIEQELQKGNVQEATAGVKELIAALGRSEKRALKSQLVRLMAPIIKWQIQPERRSYSWAATIYNAREEIHDIQTEAPKFDGCGHSRDVGPLFSDGKARGRRRHESGCCGHSVVVARGV